MAKDNDLLMGRYRRMYEAWIFGKRVNALSWQAEAFFLRVNLIADDYGNFPADPFMLIPKAGGLRRVTDVEVTDWVKEMEHKGLIRLYLVGGSDWYGHILSFTKMQPPTGAPRGAGFGRKRAYPESPWDGEETEYIDHTRRAGQYTQSTEFPDDKARYIQGIKERTPCHDCGNKFAYYLMDFDHRPGEVKLFNLSEYKGHSMQEIKAEIAKCDPVCSHCHRERTHARSSEGGPAARQSDKRYIHDDDNDEEKKYNALKGLDKREFVVLSFEYWQKKLQHPNAKLSPERIRALEARWKDSTFNELVLAIDGCESSDFHMGRQPNNPDRYDDITLVARNRAKVEWFGDKVKSRKKAPEDKRKRSEDAGRRWRGEG